MSVFSFFFSGLHFVTCGSPFFSLHSTLFVVASVLRMISFAVCFPVLGTFFFVLRSFACSNFCLFWPAVPLRPLLTRVSYTFSDRFLFLSAYGEFRSVSTFSSRVSPFVRELVFAGLVSDVSNSSVWMVLVSCVMLNGLISFPFCPVLPISANTVKHAQRLLGVLNM